MAAAALRKGAGVVNEMTEIEGNASWTPEITEKIGPTFSILRRMHDQSVARGKPPHMAKRFRRHLLHPLHPRSALFPAEIQVWGTFRTVRLVLASSLRLLHELSGSASLVRNLLSPHPGLRRVRLMILSPSHQDRELSVPRVSSGSVHISRRRQIRPR